MDVLKKFAKFTATKKHLHQSLFFDNIAAEAETCGFVIKETLAQVFSCELCKFLNYTFSYRIPSVIASAHTKCIDIAQAILGQ